MKKTLCSTIVIFLLFFFISCLSTPIKKESNIIIDDNLYFRGETSNEFLYYIKESPDYLLFIQILNELSTTIDVNIDTLHIDTYTSFSGFEGYAQSNGIINIQLDNSRKVKDFQFRVDGKGKNKDELIKTLTHSIALKMIEELKEIFIYVTGNSFAPTANINTNIVPIETDGPVFTISSEHAQIEIKPFIQRVVKSLQKIGFQIIQPEYLERLVEINRYNLSAMTEESGNIINFFDIEYLISVDKTDGFYSIDVVNVSTARVLISFNVSHAIDENQLILILKDKLSSLK